MLNDLKDHCDDSFLNGKMLLIGGKTLFRGNYKWLNKEEKDFLESRYQRNPSKWTLEETGLYAKMLGVPRKKITMWRWHRMRKNVRQMTVTGVLGIGMPV